MTRIRRRCLAGRSAGARFSLPIMAAEYFLLFAVKLKPHDSPCIVAIRADWAAVAILIGKYAARM